MRIIGVDTGGTFTDFVYRDQTGEWGVYKVLSTPRDPAEAVLAGVRHIAGEAAVQVAHGSTVATNAILERKGVKTALVTNAGFEDLIAIGRQNRARVYDLTYRHQPHIVPRELRFGIGGRRDADGTESEPFPVLGASALAERIKDSGAASVAVCFLFSYLDPSHELAMGQALDDLGVPVSLSHHILAEFREYERLSTTVVNAYVSPKMTDYLSRLQGGLQDGSLQVMQSNGGCIAADTAMRESVRTILSGPAGGVVGAHAVAGKAGFSQIMTFDMGGTSTDVCLVNGTPPLSTESTIGGYPVRVPMIDIHTVGAGGGSIARLDAGGALQVGPESAGADPGPICYGKGSEITVSDANLFLGRLVPEHFLGGSMPLATDKVDQAMQSMAHQAGLSPVALAEGILAVAEASMERALRVISVERGIDPREYTLFSFGGAGGLHCAGLARLLSMPRVLVPRSPGILSAMGMVLADVVKDYSRTVMLDESQAAPPALEELFKELEEQGSSELGLEGIDPSGITLERFLDMRYKGQSFELTVAAGEGFRERFEHQHETTYGHCNPDSPVEVVNLRLRASGALHKPRLEKLPGRTPKIPEAARLGVRQAVFEGVAVPAALYERDRLLPGNNFQGPAIVVEYSGTTVVPPDFRAEVDDWGNLVLENKG